MFDDKYLDALIKEADSLLAKETLHAYEQQGVLNLRDAALQLKAGRETLDILVNGRTTVKPEPKPKPVVKKKVDEDGSA
jgi:hypothetical protein